MNDLRVYVSLCIYVAYVQLYSDNHVWDDDLNPMQRSILMATTWNSRWHEYYSIRLQHSLYRVYFGKYIYVPFPVSRLWKIITCKLCHKSHNKFIIWKSNWYFHTDKWHPKYLIRLSDVTKMVALMHLAWKDRMNILITDKSWWSISINQKWTKRMFTTKTDVVAMQNEF